MYNNSNDNCNCFRYCLGPTGPRGATGPAGPAGGATGPTARCNKSSIYIFKW